MAARGTFSPANPGKIEMTLVVTMSINEWRIIRERLRPQASGADWNLDDSIRQMIDKANTEFHFYEQVNEPTTTS